MDETAELARYYGAILDLRGDETLREIRRTYQRKLAQHHPDKWASLAPEQRRVAEEEARELTDAYAYFRGARQVE